VDSTTARARAARRAAPRRSDAKAFAGIRTALDMRLTPGAFQTYALLLTKRQGSWVTVAEVKEATRLSEHQARYYLAELTRRGLIERRRRFMTKAALVPTSFRLVEMEAQQ
jgi:hypothetical protein